LTVASRTVSKAQALIGEDKGATACALNVQEKDKLEGLIEDADVVISLLPYTHHTLVASLCIKHKKHFISTSYVSKEMQELDAPAKQVGVMLLNEIGLDPGIDHMSAMRIIDNVHSQGGKIVSFRSYCGGLPALEANDNPFGYKFSWSPIGVILAGTNDARYKEDGKIVEIAGADLFRHYKLLNIEGLGEFEGYPNRDSVPYIDLYKIPETETMFRGTYRNIGWCPTLKAIADLGLLDKSERDFSKKSLADCLALCVPADGDPKMATAKRLGIKADDPIIGRLEWLGLFSDEPAPVEKGSWVELLAKVMEAKMPYKEGERDMIVLTHDFIAELPQGRKRLTSTLIDFGIPQGDSAMARTVSLPAAIATRLILEGVITQPGVHIPVTAKIYNPVLDELAQLKIVCREREEEV